ncbi:MAG: energy transducer TonB [Bacteroidales bacterium]|nr:energy transducer TonB [Bacteroidales bacterium]
MSTIDNCLSGEIILQYLKGELSPDMLVLTEAHLADCELCEAAVEGIRMFLADHSEERLSSSMLELSNRIQERADREPSGRSKEMRIEGADENVPGENRFKTRRLWITLGVAASILILVGFGSVVSHMVRQRNLQIAQAEVQKREERKVDRTAVQYLPSPKDQIFNEVEESPAFPGGDEALIKFLAENISCPESPDGLTTNSSLFVHFVVEEDGSVSNVKLVREKGNGCGEEAIRGIESMPRWRPGKQDGATVRVGYILMLKFS